MTDYLYIFAHSHTNNSSGRKHNLKIITSFASGEEKGKEGRIFTVYLLWSLNHRKAVPVLKMNKLNLNLKIEEQHRRSHFQYTYFKHSLNAKEQILAL